MNTQKEKSSTLKELDLKKEELDRREQGLEKREAALLVKEQKLNERIALLPVEAKEIIVEPGLEFEFRNERYKFSDDAPKQILFSGLKYSQEELAKEEDALVQLIGGESVLIEKI